MKNGRRRKWLGIVWGLCAALCLLLPVAVAASGGNTLETVMVTFDANKGTWKDNTDNPSVTCIPDDIYGSGTVKGTTFTADDLWDMGKSKLTPPTGEVFAGWNTQNDGKGVTITPYTKVKATTDLTLYAQWAKKGEVHTVTFDSTSDTVGGKYPIYVPDGKDWGVLPKPTRTGYTFDAWYLDEKYSGNPANDSYTISADTTLYPKWTPNKYTVSFKLDGAPGTAPKSITVTYDGKYTDLPSTFTWKGHDFLGWYTAANGGDKITSTNSVTTANNHTLFARWNYTLTLNANGGNVNPSSQKVAKGDSYKLPAPARTGYTFEAWYTDKDYSGTPTKANDPYTVTADTTLYAKWTVNEYKVDFDLNGAPGTAPDPITVTYDGTYPALPAAPAWTDHDFAGWFTAQAGGTEVKEGTPVTQAADHTLYAHWADSNYLTVTFDATGGAVDPPSVKVPKGGTYGALPVPARTGYAFVGWYTEAEGGTEITAGMKVASTAGHTLYAHWAPGFIVTFNANGGTLTGRTSFTTGPNNALLEMPSLDKITREKYVFTGWFTAPSGGVEVTYGSVFSRDTTVYAHWRAENAAVNPTVYTVAFSANGGTLKGTASFRTDEYGRLTGWPSPTDEDGNANPARKGYRFDGWFTAAIGGVEVDGSTVFGGSTTVYAHWTAVPTCIVEFDPNGGWGSMRAVTVELANGAYTYTLPLCGFTPPAGCHFLCWESYDGTRRYEPGDTLTLTGSTKVKAIWEADGYIVTLDPNGGALTGESRFREAYGEPYTALRSGDPTWQGKTFAGWYTARSGGQKITVFTKVAASARDQTLYAHWKDGVTVKTGTVSFDPNGGKLDPEDQVSLYIVEGDLYGELPTPEREGYVFGGWYTDKECSEDRQVTSGSAADVDYSTLYAKWTASAYSVTYNASGGGWTNANGSRRTTEQISMSGDRKFVLPSPGPDRSGYAFLGWYTKPNGGGKLVTAGTNVSEIIDAKEDVKGITLYARWASKGDAYTVYFQPNGGQVGAISITVISGGTYGALPVPERAGYTFAGWYTQETGGSRITEYTTVSLTGDQTLYALWVEDIAAGTGTSIGAGTGTGTGAANTHYTVRSTRSGSGTVNVSGSALSGEQVTVTAVPDNGYALTGLTVKDAAGNAVATATLSEGRYTFVMPTKDVVVDAVFVRSGGTSVQPAHGFVDVDPSMYCYDAVQWAAHQGILGGDAYGAFNPSGECTRAQVVNFLWRKAGSPAPRSSYNPFTDVSSGTYATNAILWAVEQGITAGTTPTTFSPNETVSRGQCMTFLYRAAGSPASGGSSPFRDVASGAYYASAVRWAVAHGITNGTSPDAFSPEDPCTRAQVITFLYRAR